jgi:hypothetical protein
VRRRRSVNLRDGNDMLMSLRGGQVVRRNESEIRRICVVAAETRILMSESSCEQSHTVRTSRREQGTERSE